MESIGELFNNFESPLLHSQSEFRFLSEEVTYFSDNLVA